MITWTTVREIQFLAEGIGKSMFKSALGLGGISPHNSTAPHCIELQPDVV